ncbi:MAG: o-succinylbenzoate synthase [Acidimicrobiaceae bacterium]|nr:o-succinylbenzoate synthase [Acidimicrobiaceae bacterium]
MERVELHRLRMPMKEPFETSFGVEYDKSVLIVAIHGGGFVGLGECGAADDPFYLEETNASAEYIITHFLVPMLLSTEFDSPEEFVRSIAHIRRNEMAKAAVEAAIWDLFSRSRGTPLYRMIGGTKIEIPVGISVGIQPTIDQLVSKVAGYLEQGYKRIKIKIKPGKEVDQVKALRTTLGDFPLMADANSAYCLEDAELLGSLDRYNLMMIEQPLAYDDLIDHAELAKKISTPICLDESIRSLSHLDAAVRLGSCQIVNLKMPRVGGVLESIKIANFCAGAGLDLWCGGLLETGVGRAFNLAITSLDAFTLPGDTAPSERYFVRDIVDRPAEFSSPGIISLSERPGVGVDFDPSTLQDYLVASTSFG